MYKMLSALYSYQSELVDLIEDFISALKSEVEFLPNNTSLESLNNKLQKMRTVNLFILVESIYLSSNKPINPIVTELEENYSGIIPELSALKSYIEDRTEMVRGDFYTLFFLIQEKISEDIAGLNKMASRYFNKSVDDLYSFDEYFAIARGQYVFGRELEAYCSDQPEALEEDLSSLVFGIPRNEIRNESTLLNSENFTPHEIDLIQKNPEAIRREIFKVSFLSEGMDINTKKGLSDEQIVQLFNFLKEHNCIQNVIRKTFKQAIVGDNITKPIVWTGSQTDAHRLKKYFEWSLKDFNSRFVLPGDKPLLKNTAPQKDDYSDLTRFLDKLEQ